MSKTECFVSVVVPIYNDSDIIESYINDAIPILKENFSDYELILVDDDSEDNTVDIIKQILKKVNCIRLIRLSRSFGQEIAISAGLESAIGDFAVVMLADSDPPELIPNIVNLSRKGAGIVYGVKKHRKHDPLLLRLGAFLFYWLVNNILKLKLPKNSTHFRVLSRQAVNAMIRVKDRFRYLHTLSSHVGYSNKSFVYETICRRKKMRKKNIGDSINLAINIIIANTNHPLRMVSFIGLCISILNLLYICYIILVYFIKEKVVEGWITQSMQMSVMFFFIVLILTILCEYIGRLIVETENRPLYHVLEEANSSVMISDIDRKNIITKSIEGNL